MPVSLPPFAAAAIAEAGQHDPYFAEFGADRDAVRAFRMDRLNEQLRVVHQHRHPLCGECLEFHARFLTCDQVAELIGIDARISAGAF
ncbi:hypothetical protein [Micromonospora sp. WMMC273]|uniref:hypothetical protein n=1 Tax=Micromonospora sp. WMMC273 TaxID=3015157 RepID=UPI0022B5F05A|nr:hypothetical protein [Micromonospora sp. WMMC273]MCZ7478901.1 hypothetical protein [Micromonospora sp. WMMC273]